MDQNVESKKYKVQYTINLKCQEKVKDLPNSRYIAFFGDCIEN